MSQFKESEVQMICEKSPDKKVSTLSTDTGFIKALTNVLNVTLKYAGDVSDALAKDKPTPSVGKFVASKTLAMSSVVEKATGSQSLSIVNFISSNFLSTTGLAKVAKLNPAQAAPHILLFLGEKVVTTAGLAELDKCKVALASLALTIPTTLVSAAGAAPISMGISIAVGAISITAASLDAYNKCSSEHK